MSSFRNWSIGARLALSFGAVLLLTGFVAALGVLALDRVNANVHEIADVEASRMEAAFAMQVYVRANSRRIMELAIAGDDRQRAHVAERMAGNQKRVDEAQDRLRRLTTDAEGKTQLDKIAVARDDMLAGYAAVRKLVEAGDSKAAVALVNGDVTQRISALTKALEEMAALQKKLMAVSVREAGETHANARLVILIGTLAAVLTGIALAFLATRSVTVPLGEAVGVANRIAEGDLSRRIEVTRGDETGKLQQALKNMSDNLNRIVATVRSTADQVAGAVGQVAHSSEESLQSAGRQAEAAAGAAAAVEQMTVAIESVSQGAQEVRTLSDRGAGGTREGKGRTDELVRSIAEVDHSVSGIAHAMQAFVSSAERINDMTRQVKELSDRTNLLALNAAIEAARAGEQGRGFAVVADEVRQLAEKSRQAAAEIEGVIDTVSAQTRELVETVQQGEASLAAARDQVGAVSASLDATCASVVDAARGVSEITNSVGEQSAASLQIARSVETISSMAQETEHAARNAMGAVDHLRALADDLRNAVGVFRVAA